MPDNVAVTAGTGTSISTDEVTTLNGATVTAVQVQRVKPVFGDDSIARDVSAAFPLPVILPDVVATGTITATDAVVPAPGGTGVLLTGTPTSGSFVAMALPGGDSVWLVQVTGTFGGGTVWFGCSADSTNGINGSWSTLSLRTIGTITTVIADGTLIAGLFRGNAAGMSYVRVRITGATAPSVAVVLRAADAVGPVALNAPLPAGTNTIGNVGGTGTAGTPSTAVLSVQGVAGATAVPVSGTFFQATQPVSLATNTPDVTDRAARLLGVLSAGANTVGGVLLTTATATGVTTMQAAAVAVGNGTNLTVTGYGTAVFQISGTFVASVAFEASVDAGVTWTAISATQVGSGDIVTVATVLGLYRSTSAGLDLIRARVSAFTSGSVTVTGRASNAINASKIVKLASGTAAIGHINEMRAATLAVTATAATGVAATLTIPAAGVGLFHYVTGYRLRLYSTAARTGVAAPILVTTTNLPGALAHTFDTAGAIGTSLVQEEASNLPLKSSVANTATTIVAPIVVGGIWRITATYFTAA